MRGPFPRRRHAVSSTAIPQLDAPASAHYTALNIKECAARGNMTPEENDLLCRVEGNAPMGQIMRRHAAEENPPRAQIRRRHWIAACLSEEVAEPDGAPRRVRLLGENLVVFRDTKGPIGVLDEYSSHRRASLVYARNEECGLRCLYHDWKFDVDGNVVEMASEPAESSI